MNTLSIYTVAVQVHASLAGPLGRLTNAVLPTPAPTRDVMMGREKCMLEGAAAPPKLLLLLSCDESGAVGLELPSPREGSRAALITGTL